MVMCAVYGCNRNNNKTFKNIANKNSSIGFHHFPKNAVLCKKWVHKCSRSDLFLTKNARICSKHFKDSDSTELNN